MEWATLDDAERRDVALAGAGAGPGAVDLGQRRAGGRVPGRHPQRLDHRRTRRAAGLPARPRRPDPVQGAARPPAATSRPGWATCPPGSTLPPMPMLERLELAQAVAAPADRRHPGVPGGGGLAAAAGVHPGQPADRHHPGPPGPPRPLHHQSTRSRRSSHQLRTAPRPSPTTPPRAAAPPWPPPSTTASPRPSPTLSAPSGPAGPVPGLHRRRRPPRYGRPAAVSGPVPAVAGLDRDAGIALLDRAAEIGLLTAYGDGYYAVHPAVPWHLHDLFEHHYGPPGSPPAQPRHPRLDHRHQRPRRLLPPPVRRGPR